MTTRAESLASRGEAVLRGEERRFRIWPFLGPAFIASVAYIDPGNFATNIQAGSKFGFLLLWVIVASNLMAMLIQTLSAKLGIATGKNLAEVCRESFSRRTSVVLWLQAEVIAMATDLAEFLGAALGFHLLFGWGLFPATVVTGIVAMIVLGLQRYGFRPLEATIATTVGLIAVCYLAELVTAKPSLGAIGRHAVTPMFSGKESVLLATGILGATVMPHVIYLHSSLTQDRIRPQSDAQARRLMRFTRIDVIVAMTLAGLINMAMLIVAAKAFHGTGLDNIDSIDGAHRALTPILGQFSSVLFALALLFSGLSSSTVGTMSGQVVMQGFVRRQVPLSVRRTVTMAPALVVAAIGVDPTRTLVLSQVMLSFGIPFALIPLVLFTSRRRLMRTLVNGRATITAAVLIAALIVALNIFLIAQTLGIV